VIIRLSRLGYNIVVTITSVSFSGRPAAPSSRTLRRVRDAMDRDGAVALEGLFPMPLLTRIRREVLRRHESGELRRRGLVRDIGGRYAAVLPFTGPFLDPAFYASPRLQGVMDALLGPDRCIGSLEAVISLPGSSEQHQHIDGPIRFDRMTGGRRERFAGDLSALPSYAVTLCVPLCDVDEDNGPTALWPGSHRAALRPRPPGDAEIRRRYPEVRMTGAFGRSFLFDYRIFHGGTSNMSREPRPILMFVFTRSWFRDPNVNDVWPSVVVTAKALRRVPERLRPLFMLAPSARRALWTRG
jgi:ectoine hydroxylase-related dioxygenase (phytanoyl-CoA dioxygenase family)